MTNPIEFLTPGRKSEAEGQTTVKRSKFIDFVYRLLKEKPLGTLGLVIVTAMVIVAIFAGPLAPYDMDQIHLADRLKPPSSQYLFGTDDLGRDLLSRIIFGARISLVVGLAGSTLSTLVATFIGVLSGFFGGALDIVMQRFVDAWMCFPGMFIVLTVMALLGPGLWQVVVVLGILTGIGSSRVVRSAAIGIKENMYVSAATALGCSRVRMLSRHILPNVTAPLIVLFTVAMGGMIISEATLSFLGFGVPPPAPSWGGMLSGSGRSFMLRAPWMAIWPGVALSVVVWGINVFGDALRDLLDPKLRGGVGRYTGLKKQGRHRYPNRR